MVLCDKIQLFFTYVSHDSRMPVPLIFLPGMLCDHRLWRYQTSALSGLTECHTPLLREHDSITALATHVLDNAPDSFALCGLSMGGYVAFEILRQAPERVRRLALIATSARPDTAAQTSVRERLMALAKHGKFQGVTPSLLPSLLHPDSIGRSDVTDIIMEMARDTGQEAFLRQEVAVINRIDSRPSLPEIQCETLILCGEADRRTPPEYSEEMASLIPHATLYLLPGAGHLPPLEQPEAVTRHLKAWLV